MAIIVGCVVNGYGNHLAFLPIKVLARGMTRGEYVKNVGDKKRG